jgi:hypothetical protein
VPFRDVPLDALARERRALHVEGLLAAGATVGLVAAAGLGVPLLALAPAALGYAVLTTRWVVRYVGVLGRDCPRCGALFFYSIERLLYSLPYLSPRCAHCRQSLSRPEPPRRLG